MLVKFENPKLLSDVVAIISELVTEVKINVSENGMSIVAIDPANVALVFFKLPASAFSQFESSGKEMLGVNLDSLKSILRRCKTGSNLIMQSKENMLNISIEDKIKRNFSLLLIDIEGEEKAVPILDFTSVIEINSSDLVDSIEDCAIVADACSFITQKDKFVIEAKEMNTAMSEFSSDEVKIQAKEESVKSRYSLEYLQKIIKSCKLVEKTKIRFSQDYPLKIEFKTEKMELSFVLAPRVETED